MGDAGDVRSGALKLRARNESLVNLKLSVKTRHPATPALPSAEALILFNKPYGVLCQFTGDGTKRTLADFIRVPDVYPAGRLDTDSEGLMLLTANGRIQARIADPRHKLPKVYWAQVEGAPQPEQLERLERGVELTDGLTRPAQARLLPAPPDFLPRDPPIRHRLTVPTAWLELTLTEGRNRQVRRMTAAVGLPTLRLIRIAMGRFTLEGLAPGAWRALEGDDAVL